MKMFRFVKSKSISRESSLHSIDKLSGDSDSPSTSHRRLDSSPANRVSTKNTSIPTPTSQPGSFVVAAADHSKLGTTVRQILDNPTIAKRFRAYAASLHADEGLKFLEDLQASYDLPDQVMAADKIMHRFFLDDATDQVNLPANIRTELFERFQTKQYDTVADLFTDTTMEVFTDIKKSDTFRNFLMIDEEAKRISSDETLLLDRWVVSENFRVALQAVQDDTELSNLIRFCSSVSEFEKEEDKVARKARGNKIAATFVQPGSTFQVTLPQYYTDSILGGKYEFLPDARIECLQILAKSPALMETVRKSLTVTRRSSTTSRDSTQPTRTQDVQQCFVSGQGTKLIQKLMEKKLGDGTPAERAILNKARFCSAVATFMAAPGTSDSNQEKLGMARKIVSNFVQIGGLFQVELATGFVEDLCNSKHPDYAPLFSVIYQQFVSDLAMSDVVDEAIHSLSSA